MTTFSQHQDVAAVEHDDSTRQPREGGKVKLATVTQLGGIYVQVRYEGGALDGFYAESGWRAWDGEFRWRLVPLCCCDEPVTGTPVTDPDDRSGRVYCSEGCRDSDAEGAYEQAYQPGVAT